MLLLRSPACWSAWYSPTGSFAGCIPPRGRAPSPSLGTRGGAGRLDQRAADAAYIRPRSIGEVAEWPKAPDSKSGLGASPTWVRLPPSPRKFGNPHRVPVPSTPAPASKARLRRGWGRLQLHQTSPQHEQTNLEGIFQIQPTPTRTSFARPRRHRRVREPSQGSRDTWRDDR